MTGLLDAGCWALAKKGSCSMLNRPCAISNAVSSGSLAGAQGPVPRAL